MSEDDTQYTGFLKHMCTSTNTPRNKNIHQNTVCYRIQLLITEASLKTTADLRSIGDVKPSNTCIAKHFELVLCYQRCPDLLAY